MCRTPEELAAPVDEAGALSFRVPLGRGGTELGGIGAAAGSKVGKAGGKGGKGGKLGGRPAKRGLSLRTGQSPLSERRVL